LRKRPAGKAHDAKLVVLESTEHVIENDMANHFQARAGLVETATLAFTVMFKSGLATADCGTLPSYPWRPCFG